ncbi:ATP-dependent DNA ligase [Streptomyces werraensis]
MTLVAPELVVEVGVDVTRDRGGRWRHAARWHRARPDVAPGEVPRFQE